MAKLSGGLSAKALPKSDFGLPGKAKRRRVRPPRAASDARQSPRRRRPSRMRRASVTGPEEADRRQGQQGPRQGEEELMPAYGPEHDDGQRSAANMVELDFSPDNLMEEDRRGRLVLNISKPVRSGPAPQVADGRRLAASRTSHFRPIPGLTPASTTAELRAPTVDDVGPVAA